MTVAEYIINIIAGKINPLFIGVLWFLIVACVAIYLVIKEVEKESRLKEEEDFITAWLGNLEQEIDDSDVGFSRDMYLRIMLIAPVVFGILAQVLIGNLLITALVVVAGFFIPRIIFNFLVDRKDKDFEEHFARSLEQLSSSLRAGMSIAQAVEDVANCQFVHPSMRKLYAKLSADLTMGFSVNDSFKRFAAATNSIDAKDVSTAIDVQNEVGGHEAEVVAEIANNINERIMMRRELKSIFSGTTSMVYIMDFIGPAVILYTFASSPSYQETYFSDPLYTIIFIVFIVMMLVGSFINHSMLRNSMKGGN